MKNKKMIVNIVLLTLTFIIGISIIYPGVSNIIENRKEDNFNLIKADIFKNAKDKYNNDPNDSNEEYKIYKVSDLIKEGYMTKDSIKEGYNEDSKVLITNENGKIKYYYINGDTLLNIIKNKENDDVQLDDGNYLYTGKNSSNYISFNQEIYRIIMIDSKGYVYIIKDLCDNNVRKDKIDEYLSSYYNDSYTKKIKELIDGNISVIDYNTYNRTILNDKTYINSSKDMWIKKDDDYKIIATDTSEIMDSINSDYACIKVHLKLKNTSFIEKGDGTQFNPYVISIQNY